MENFPPENFPLIRYVTSAVLQIIHIYVFLVVGIVVCCTGNISTYIFKFTVFVDILIISLFLVRFTFLNYLDISS
jgi:hypothetical protein